MRPIFYTFIIILSVFLTLGCAYNQKYDDISSENAVKNIHTATDNIRSITDDKVIHTQTVVIDTNTEDLGTANQALTTKADKLQKDLDKASSRYEKLYKTTLITIIIAAGLGLTLTVILFVLGSLKSIIPAIICGGLLIGSIMLFSLYAYFLYIGIGAAVILLGITIYVVIIKRRALHETVASVDKAKEIGAIDWDKFQKIADETQSKTTQKVVDKIQQ